MALGEVLRDGGRGREQALYTPVITGAFLAVLPLFALFLVVQRFWSLDLLSGVVES